MCSTIEELRKSALKQLLQFGNNKNEFCDVQCPVMVGLRIVDLLCIQAK